MIDLLLLDGNGAAFRHHVVAEQKFRTPVPESAPSLPAVVPFGLINLVSRFVQQYRPRRVVVCWDTQGSWARRARIFEGYKQNRVTTKTPEEKMVRAHYRVQIRAAMAMFWMLGVEQAAGPEFEADDLLAWYALRAPGPTVVLSSDKDLRLLVRPGCTVVDPFRMSVITHENFNSTVGVASDRYLEYLALVGDEQDGIVGVEQVGPKTAQRWLAEWSTAEEIVANATKPRLALQNLAQGLEIVKRNRRLIDLHWVQEVSQIPARPGHLDLGRAYSFCQMLAMNSVVSDWGTYENTFGTLWSTTA